MEMFVTNEEVFRKLSCCGLLLILLLIRKCLEVCQDLFNIKIHVSYFLFTNTKGYTCIIKKIMNLPLSNKQEIFEGGIWDELNKAVQNFSKIHEDFSV